MKPTRLVAVMVLAACLSACGGGGPRLGAILNAPNAEKVDRTTAEEPFVLVDLGLGFAERVSASKVAIAGSMPQAGAQPFVIGVGDRLDVSIVFNNESGGFIDFSQSAISPIATTTLPQQVVAEDGTVAVPQLGRVRAQGKSVQSFERLLTRRLSEVLINPTAVVQMVDRQSATVTLIGGGIGGTGSYPINLADRRLLDIIGRAGGPSGEAKDIIVTLSRGGQEYSAVLSDIYQNKALNVFVRDGDFINVEPRTTRVKVLGATGNTILELSEVNVTLMDVISRAGGLQSPRAALKGVFVYRDAPVEQLHAIGADLSAFPGRQTVPTVFRVDLSHPTAFFTGKKFQMMDDDIVYVADNLATQLSNFFGSARTFAVEPVSFVRDASLAN